MSPLHSPHSLQTAFAGKKILVVGDLMLDRYLRGVVNRQSPEAPVPVVDISEEETRLGGAANVALNLASLGAEPLLCGGVGDDHWGAECRSMVKAAGWDDALVLTLTGRKTTVKTRVIGNDQHLVRVDREQTHALTEAQRGQALELILASLGECDALIFEDYDKGFLDASLIREVVAAAVQRNLPVVVDPKFRQFMDYEGVTLFKPNLKELCEALHIQINKNDVDSLQAAMQELRKMMPHQITVVTLGDAGIAALESTGHFLTLPARPSKVQDVSGAGDTVVAVLTLGLIAGLPLPELLRLATLAGGLVVEQVGVVPVNAQQLLAEFNPKSM